MKNNMTQYIIDIFKGMVYQIKLSIHIILFNI